MARAADCDGGATGQLGMFSDCFIRNVFVGMYAQVQGAKCLHQCVSYYRLELHTP